MKALFLIPARGGSKGIPHKNSRLLAGKPLVGYSIEAALQLASPQDICVSTDDEDIAGIAAGYGLSVPFIRPAELASDTSGSYEVIMHALDFYAAQGREYESVVLLQPTSPFRTSRHISEAMNLYTAGCDMVVSVVEAKSNPYFVMFGEGEDGFLHRLLEGGFTRRQDAPPVYEYNGAVYVLNVGSLRTKHLSAFTRNRKYIMPPADSIDLDTPEDWEYAEYLLGKRK